MHGKLLHEIAAFSLCSGYAAAGTGTTNGDGIDMQGYDTVTFVGIIGTGAANNLLHAEQSSDDAGTDAYTDIEDSEVDLVSAETQQMLTIHCPEERYVRPVMVRGTSSTIVALIAYRYNARDIAVDNDVSGTIVTKSLLNPVAGTK